MHTHTLRCTPASVNAQSHPWMHTRKCRCKMHTAPAYLHPRSLQIHTCRRKSATVDAHPFLFKILVCVVQTPYVFRAAVRVLKHVLLLKSCSVEKIRHFETHNLRKFGVEDFFLQLLKNCQSFWKTT